MSTLLASFLGLVKNNDGFFKSCKQRDFLLSKTEDGIYVVRQTLHFGEWDGRTRRNTTTVEWTIYCDNEGVTLVEKYTPKQGITTYWQRTEAYIRAAAERKELAIKESLVHAKDRKSRVMKEITSEYAEVKGYTAFMNDASIREALGASFIVSTIEKHKSTLNRIMADYQEWLTTLEPEVIAQL